MYSQTFTDLGLPHSKVFESHAIFPLIGTNFQYLLLLFLIKLSFRIFLQITKLPFFPTCEKDSFWLKEGRKPI